MKTARTVNFMFLLIFTFVLSACAAPTPIVIVVTATPLPPTEAPSVEPTATLAPVSVDLAGPQSGTQMKWIDGSTLIYVPPAEFEMGYDGFDAPKHTVSVDGVWIYETKVTNRMYAQCVAVGSCTPPSQEVGGPVYSNPQFANHPVIGVTWDQAQGYCGWSQGRLPTEAEWEKTARGTDANIYPWGNDEPGCDLLNFGLCSGRTSEVDAFPDGVSPYGALDMAGNTFEWVGDWYDANYYSVSEPANPNGPVSGQSRSIRGSSFESTPDQVGSAVRHFGPQTYHNRDVGFRCAVPEPKPFAPYCQLAAFIPSGSIVSNGCTLPDVSVTNQYCSQKISYAYVDMPSGSIFDDGKNLNCEEVEVGGRSRLVCIGPEQQEVTNEVTVCNPACSNSPDVTGESPTCDPGYTLDPTSHACNYTPIIGQVNVSGCPVGYSLTDRGGQQTCVISTDANGQCTAGLYFDTLAQMCVPPNGSAETPYGIDNPSLASQTYAGCAAGFTYSEQFQCCQAATGGTYPGCAPGTTFNADLGACSAGEIKLSGPGCVTVDVTTLKCSQPVDICALITKENACVRNAYFCIWDDPEDRCVARKK